MRQIFAGIAGALFGIGLLLSGMTDTAKIRGFLDVFGAWDPTLLFVMGGAVLPMAAAWALTTGRRPVLGGQFPSPAEEGITTPLVIGSGLFGLGWGLAGLCPGPSMAALGFGGIGVWIFGISMLAGMAGAPRLRRHLDALA